MPRKPTRVRPVCAVCGQDFSPPRPHKIRKGEGRFCSRACYHRSRVTAQERTCEQCGTAFVAAKAKVEIGEGRFCSKRCGGLFRRLSAEELFFRHVGRKTSTGCILWAGCTNACGYGSASRGNGITRTVLAHRLAYEVLVGPVPAGLHVLHHCDNPPCINPTHLFLGTHRDNMDDATAKRRHPHGERHSKAKLTEADVLTIRARYDGGDHGIKRIAAEYGVCLGTIRQVITNRCWTHLLP